jgi:hypothetical protein
MTNPFSKLAELQARARAMKSSVIVPSGNGASGNSLALALSRVAAAEKNLEEARSTARATARGAGKTISGLFSESQFVGRGTAERWTDAARSEGFENGKAFAREEITRVMMQSRGLDYETEMKKIRAEQAANTVKWKAYAAQWRAEMEAAGFFAACDAGDFKLAGQIYFEKHPEERRGNAARAILAAATRRDSDPSNERPDPTGLARAIVNSGRRRRNEPEIK